MQASCSTVVRLRWLVLYQVEHDLEFTLQVFRGVPSGFRASARFKPWECRFLGTVVWQPSIFQYAKVCVSTDWIPE